MADFYAFATGGYKQMTERLAWTEVGRLHCLCDTLSDRWHVQISKKTMPVRFFDSWRSRIAS